MVMNCGILEELEKYDNTLPFDHLSKSGAEIALKMNI